MPFRKIRKLLRRRAGFGDFSRLLDKYVAGNKLTLLSRGADVFRSMWEAIDSARETIHLETYILSSDRTGAEFARRLEAKTKSGVRVRLIFDAVGSLGIDPGYLARLRNAGVSILEYHPVAPWRPRWSWGRRDHRKIMVVDGRVAFTGGVNISDRHAPIEEGGADWRDAHVRLEGPAASELDRLIRAVWFRETGRWFKCHGGPDGIEGKSRVWVAANQEFLRRYGIHSSYLSAVRAARKEVLIANAYFLPGRPMRAALAAAARRGVEVRILVQGHSDIPSVWRASRALYDRLLRRGVRLFAWPGPILHEKVAVVDGRWSAIGSYNMDHRSLLHNLEVNLHVLDAEFAAGLSGWIKEGIKKSPELTLEGWRRRPLGEKLLERVLYQFRYFF